MKGRLNLLAIMMAVLVSAVILPTASVSGQEAEDIAKWTFMVYLDADNNLEGPGIEDMNEMETVGSTDDVNIVVQMDRIDEYDTSNGDWTDTRRFLMERDNEPDTVTSEELQNLGEVNMGDPRELVDFVEWSVDSYPAENYALVLWDHGGAFRGICFDDTVPDSDTYDMINMTEMNWAAEQIYQVAGNRRIDLWGFDACLMAQVAVMYELKDYVDVGVGSGFNEPGDGWPYEKVLEHLVSDPEMDERELGEIIAREYIESYNNNQDDPEDYPMVTQACFDMRKMNDLVITLDRFAEELASRGVGGGLEYLTQIYIARATCNSYDMVNLAGYDLTGYPLYDVIDFTRELESLIVDAFGKNDLLLRLCSDVRIAVNATMFYSEADQWHPDANGLSMYFPNKEEGSVSLTQLPTNYHPSYEETSYAKLHLWDDFLHAFYAIEPIEDSRPTITITNPEFNTSFSSNLGIVNLTGKAYDREMVDRVEIRIDRGEWITVPGISGPGEITWIHQIDVSKLEPGTHEVEARAFDRPIGTPEGSPGQSTLPVSTYVHVEPSSEDEGTHFEIPAWFLQVVALFIIIGGLIFGMTMFRGRAE